MKGSVAVSLLGLLSLAVAQKHETCRGGPFGKNCPEGTSCYYTGGAAIVGQCIPDGVEVPNGVTKRFPQDDNSNSDDDNSDNGSRIFPPPLPKPSSTPKADWCGGIAAKQCPSGQICKDPGPNDIPGTCVSNICGGFVNQKCPDGYTCKRTGGSIGTCIHQRQGATTSLKATSKPTSKPTRTRTPVSLSTPTPTFTDTQPSSTGLPTTNNFCGGYANTKCPYAAQICVDDPTDICDPANGGYDCGGICVTPSQFTCAGFIGKRCGVGHCVDAPNDGCDPLHGGADCGGVCVVDYPGKRLQRCGTKGTDACKSGEKCWVDPKSYCAGAMDCPGWCSERDLFGVEGKDTGGSYETS